MIINGMSKLSKKLLIFKIFSMNVLDFDLYFGRNYASGKSLWLDVKLLP